MLRCLACCAFILLALPAHGAAQPRDDVQTLIKKLNSSFSSEVVAAARALERIGPEGKEAVPALSAALLKANFPEERLAVARAIGRMGPAGRDAVPGIVQALKKASFSSEKKELVKVLGNLGPAAREAVPPLTEILRTGFMEDAKAAAEALGEIGPAARDAIPALKQASQTGFTGVRTAAREAITKIERTQETVGLKDNARFFSQVAARKALDEIQDIAAKHQVDLLVESYAGVPAGEEVRVKAMSDRERARYFTEMASTRTQAVGFEGVYLLICREPSYLHLHVTPRTRMRFDDRAADKLRDLMAEEFRNGRYDGGLLTGLTFLRGQLAAGAASK